jgi:Amt family ammonium transporter
VELAAFLEPDRRLAFRVSDTGVGIAKEDIPLALEPFRQINLDSTVYAAEGTGLGLPLTRALARLHGASLVIESEPRQGTTITVRMPYTRTVEDNTMLATA